MNQHPQELLEHLRTVVATALDAPVQLVPGTMGTSGWRIRVIGPASAQSAITFDTDGATALAKALTASGSAAPEAVKHTLNDLCSHAITAGVAGQPGDATPEFRVEPAEFIDWLPIHGATVAGLRCESLGITIGVSVGRDAVVPEARPGAAVNTAAANASRFGVLMDINVPLVVRFGCTDMPVKALARLGPGSLIDLSRAPEDPVEVLVGGRVVARGEVVVVSGSYGIRIVDVADGRSQALGLEA